jgi:hypothetical protein
MENIKKTLVSLILAGCFLFGSKAEGAEDQEKQSIKGNAYITRIETDKGAGINRLETTLTGLPFNSDTYTLFEGYEEGYYGKVRIQSLPINTGNVSLGAAAQRKFAPFLPNADNQLGLVGRIQGSPIKNSFGKMDLRYFPKEKELDAYAFVDTEKVYIDVLACYNLDSKTAFLLPGMDYKINPNLSVGLEASMSGTSKLKTDYTGIRVKLSF